MDRKRSERYVALNELICELAYGRKMTYAEMTVYERENNCVPAYSKRRDPLVELVPVSYAGGITYGYSEDVVRTDEALRSPAYCEARDFIFEHAEAGSVCILARSPKEKEGDGDITSIPAIYRQIPREAFIAEHLFAPDEPPAIWPKEGCLAVDAEWYYPKLLAGEADKLVREWRSGGATKRTGGRPTVVDWTMVQQKAHWLMEHNGDFNQVDPDWNVQAKLEVRLLEYCSNTFGKEPSMSALRARIPSWLAEWRLSRDQVRN